MPELQERFGKGIKKRRIELGFSQEKLAEKAGVHRTYLADVERGERNLSLENIHKIISALNLSPSDFYKKYFE
ncbi:MAG: helix-turn-helix transcriptional regulator [Chloroflexota bacterium]